eukprot:1500876-Pyramimonas_sp.AAC.1
MSECAWRCQFDGEFYLSDSWPHLAGRTWTWEAFRTWRADGPSADNFAIESTLLFAWKYARLGRITNCCVHSSRLP